MCLPVPGPVVGAVLRNFQTDGLVKTLKGTLGRKFSKSKLAEELKEGAEPGAELTPNEEKKIQTLQQRLEVRSIGRQCQAA